MWTFDRRILIFSAINVSPRSPFDEYRLIQADWAQIDLSRNADSCGFQRRIKSR